MKQESRHKNQEARSKKITNLKLQKSKYQITTNQETFKITIVAMILFQNKNIHISINPYIR
jgi:hypothetical protein